MRILGIGTVFASCTGINEFQQKIKNKIIPDNYYDTDLSSLGNFINPSKIRRLDNYSKSSLLAAYLAVEDSGIKITDPGRIGIITGTGNGPLNTTFEFLDNIIEYGDESSSPLLFANSVHNAPASHISINMGITGPCFTITCFEQTVSNVFKTAEYWLNTGLVDYVLAGTCDETHEAADYSIKMMNKKSSGTIKPFVLNDSSYIQSEGYAFFLLGNIGSGYCSINNIFLRNNSYSRMFNNTDYIIVSGNGSCRTNPCLKKLVLNKPVTAYSYLYGSLMTGSAFDIAVAAVAVKAGILYPPAVRETDSPSLFKILNEEAEIKNNTIIGCIEPGDSNEFNYYEISS